LVSYYQSSDGTVTLHPRETTSSGRPKALMASEDDYFIYTQSRSGDVASREKSNLEHYVWWRNNHVEFNGENRITPLTDFEKSLGIGLSRTHFDYRGQVYTQEEFERLFRDNPNSGFCNADGQCDWTKVGEHAYQDRPTKKEDGGGENWQNYFKRKASEKDLIVESVERLEFRAKQKPAVVEKVRPNPKEVEKVEPIEVEPIKEAVKYSSPLLIAGVIAVVVILLLKRRRA